MGFLGARRGTPFIYTVVDRNYRAPNAWEFVVRVPSQNDDRYLEVRPRLVPPHTAWAGLDGRSLEFAKCNRRGSSNMAYAKLAIAFRSHNGIRTARLNTHDLAYIPAWLRTFGPIAKKDAVRGSGSDGGSLEHWSIREIM